MVTHSLVRESRSWQALKIHDSLIERSIRHIKNKWMDDKSEMGRRIRLARERRNWTQAELCGRVPGLAVTTLSGYETGRREPTLSVIKDLAKALNVSAAYISTLDDNLLSDEEQHLLRNYRASDDRGKHQIFTISEAECRYTSNKSQLEPHIIQEPERRIEPDRRKDNTPIDSDQRASKEPRRKTFSSLQSGKPARAMVKSSSADC